MKKLLSLLLVLSTFMFTLTACGQSKSEVSGALPEPIQEKIAEITPELQGEQYLYSEGMGRFVYNGKYGYLDGSGKVVIEPKYKYATSFSEGYALARTGDDKLVIIDKQGKEVFESEKYAVSPDTPYSEFHENAAMVINKFPSGSGPEYKYNYTLIDTKGEWLLDSSSSSLNLKGVMSCGFIVSADPDGTSISVNSKNGLGTTSTLTGFVPEDIPELNFTDNLLAIPDFGDKTWNVIDTKCQKVFQNNFEKLKQPSEGMIPFMKGGKWGYINYQGSTVIEPQYEDANSFSQGLASVKVNGKIGFIDNKNNMVIKPQFQAEVKDKSTTYYKFDSNGFAIVPDKNGSVINMKGQIILTAPFQGNISYDGDGIICFYNDKETKLYDLKPEDQSQAQSQEQPKEQPQSQEESSKAPAEEVNTLKAVEITPEAPSGYYAYSDGLGLFTYNDSVGFLDSNGKVFIEPKYGFIGNPFSEGFAIVSNKEKQVVILDKNGNEVFKSDKYAVDAGYMDTYNSYCFHEGRAIFYNRSDGYHIIDTTGKEIYAGNKNEDEIGYYPLQYYSCGRLIWYQINSNKIRIIDKDGNVILKDFATAYTQNSKQTLLYYDNLLSLPDSNNKWGVLDINGKTVVDFAFEELGYAGDGLIPFMKYGKWGYIDYKGNVVIEPQYKNAYGFSNGLAAVEVDNKIGFINTKNEMVIQPAFQASQFPYQNRFFDNGLAVVGSGLIDRKGSIIIPGTIFYNGGNIVSVGQANQKIYRIEGLQ